MFAGHIELLGGPNVAQPCYIRIKLLSKRLIILRSLLLLFFPDLSLQDSLLHEYKKVCSAVSVRIMSCGRTGRYAVIYFSTMSDVDRALEETRNNKYFLDWPVEADVFLAGDELIDDK